MGEMTLSLDTLLRKYGPLMRYIIAPILSDPRDREECLQDAALRAWQNLAKYDPRKGSFTTWLTVLTRNAALNRARGLRPPAAELDETLEAPNADPEAIVIEKERRQALADALATLTFPERALFYRKYYYRQSTAQIAAETGLSPRAVEGRLYRIKKHLKKKLGGGLYD